MSIFRRFCIACDQSGRRMDKEHFWPEWLIEMTRTNRTGVRWLGKHINPNSAKIPICVDCNGACGRELEEPTRKAFIDVEAGLGLSDEQCEVIVRWLWKFVGFAWRLSHPHGKYTQRYTVRDRVLRPIDDIRPHVTLAVSLIAVVEPDYGDAPMGLDTPQTRSAVCAAGVFSRIAVAVIERQFEGLLDAKRFSFYQFGKRDPATGQAKLFFPQTGFSTCTHAVAYMHLVGPRLASVHEEAMAAREHP